ncbi:MAG: bifunctional UDP-N-acetylglucosamine diphosphorylase/glucosamine-1-phosphate N-acetyltransferase GlmU [Ruminococcus sp.]|nr:bifunctional UDP-N-acetylglucosamine diphosphorylase/glucosamine-1-phosphate N-acetyltransferase GlmU [Ruminococcus sp.]
MNKAIILAGGQGKRMKADMPKPLFKVLGEPMLEWVISACEDGGAEDICVVKGFRGEMIDEYLSGRYQSVLQAERLGTGHAVMQAEQFLKQNTDGNTLVLCGDAPFIDGQTIKNSLTYHMNNDNAVTVITAELDNPYGYGRIIRTENGIGGIVEQKDADESQRKINEVNSGAYWFRTADLLDFLGKIDRNNAQGEYYLTDTVGIAVSEGKKAGAYKSANADIIKGANNRKDLLELNTYARMAVIEKHLENGVEFTCTDGVIIERDVKIGTGTEILPNTIIRGKTIIGNNCKIGAETVIENCTIGNNVVIDTAQVYNSVVEDDVKIEHYVHIRPDSVIRKNAYISDFVEIKNSIIGERTAVSHLVYIGDSDVGRKVNIGAGTVTVNYDGIAKSRCEIGDRSFVGCNTNLIAPVKLGKAVYTGAGTTVTRDIPDYALVIDRGVLKVKEGYTLRKFKTDK